MKKTTNNLPQLYKIQQALKESGYFDISRISQEIFQHCNKENISPTFVIKEIKSGKPWEYIKGECEFYQNIFKVNENTLIPRVESEQLVDIAIDFLKKNSNCKYVVDVGTGSGCIIIFLVKNLCDKKNIKFLATDIDLKALRVAKENARLHKVNEKILFSKTNLLSGLKINGSTLIIANLPYIPSDMYKKLDRSVKEFEPKVALDGGANGLKYYRKLLAQINNMILDKNDCSLLVEIEPSTLKSFLKMLNMYNPKDIEILKDFREKKRFLLIHFS